MLKGIDISHHQNDAGAVDWSRIKAEGYEFAFIKLTEGETFIDPKGHQNVKDAQAHGFIVGGYHFARYKSPAEAKREADFFAKHANNLNLDFAINDLEHAEDMREHGIKDITSATHAFMAEIAKVAKPLLYTYPSFIRGYLNPSANIHDLWIANYGVDAPDMVFWDSWRVWQHSSSAHVSGLSGRIDVNLGHPEYLLNGKTTKPHKAVAKMEHAKPADNLLERGDRGAKIRELQTHLYELGHYHGKIDGDFGPKTQAAVESFQRPAHIKVDGIVGPHTLKALDKALNYPGHLLRLEKPYMRDRAVGIVQRLLILLHHDLKADNIYGPKTAAAVKEFQADHGLKPDKIVGEKTWTAMFGK